MFLVFLDVQRRPRPPRMVGTFNLFIFSGRQPELKMVLVTDFKSALSGHD